VTDLFSYADLDGDKLAVFDALIPVNGEFALGVNIRTTRLGCSIPLADMPALIGALKAHYDLLTQPAGTQERGT